MGFHKYHVALICRVFLR